ncbi:unnamed protein product [Meloidogyne enterolobii]
MEGAGGGISRLGRTQEDLNRCRMRIDANVENQKEYSENIATMHKKIIEYRKNIKDLERKLGLQKGHQPLTTIETPISFLGDSGFLGDGTTLWSGRETININYENVLMKLDDERRRCEDLRMELEQERMQSERFQSEIMEIQREFEREIREKDRQHKNKEKNLTEYLRDEQKKVLDVWTELKRVRRQFVDLREQTERELDNQKEEITRLLKNIRINGIEGGGGKVFTDEKIIFEIIRRIKDGKGGREIFDYDGKIKTESGEEINSELYKELIKKYEDVLERNIQFESSKDENARRVSELEAELRAAKEKLSGYQNATRKIYEICSINSSTEGVRSRSLSPPKINPFDAVRNVQKALQKRDNEIQQLGEKLRGIERLQIELNTKLAKNEETKRGIERDIISMRRNIQELERSLDESERERRRLDDKYKMSMSDLDASEASKKILENELNLIKQQIEKIAGEEKRKAREEIEQFKNDLESDYSNR